MIFPLILLFERYRRIGNNYAIYTGIKEKQNTRLIACTIVLNTYSNAQNRFFERRYLLKNSSTINNKIGRIICGRHSEEEQELPL